MEAFSCSGLLLLDWTCGDGLWETSSCSVSNRGAHYHMNRKLLSWVLRPATRRHLNTRDSESHCGGCIRRGSGCYHGWRLPSQCSSCWFFLFFFLFFFEWFQRPGRWQGGDPGHTGSEACLAFLGGSVERVRNKCIINLFLAASHPTRAPSCPAATPVVRAYFKAHRSVSVPHV